MQSPIFNLHGAVASERPSQRRVSGDTRDYVKVCQYKKYIQAGCCNPTGPANRADWAAGRSHGHQHLPEMHNLRKQPPGPGKLLLQLPEQLLPRLLPLHHRQQLQHAPQPQCLSQLVHKASRLLPAPQLLAEKHEGGLFLLCCLIDVHDHSCLDKCAKADDAVMFRYCCLSGINQSDHLLRGPVDCWLIPCRRLPESVLHCMGNAHPVTAAMSLTAMPGSCEQGLLGLHSSAGSIAVPCCHPYRLFLRALLEWSTQCKPQPGQHSPKLLLVQPRCHIHIRLLLGPMQRSPSNSIMVMYKSQAPANIAKSAVK